MRADKPKVKPLERVTLDSLWSVQKSGRLPAQVMLGILDFLSGRSTSEKWLTIIVIKPNTMEHAKQARNPPTTFGVLTWSSTLPLRLELMDNG